MLASVMLKMGTYGLVRFCLPHVPRARRASALRGSSSSPIIGIIYGALVAMVQPNMKKLVAYSSVSHLGFVVLGIFSFTQLGLDGAVYQMLNHGISTGALFILVGYPVRAAPLARDRRLRRRRHRRARGSPSMFLITTLASIGLPLLNNFVGEFLVLQGAAQANFRWAVFAAIGVILSAGYMLWMYQRVFYGETPDEVTHHMPDLTPREWAIVLPLVVLMVWMGIGTQTFLPPIRESNAAILESMSQRPVVAAQEVRHAR